jgi:hypothetical protein
MSGRRRRAVARIEKLAQLHDDRPRTEAKDVR